MAIVQISKIQQRAGNLVDLPQLDNAEFGWATDTNRLFIGRTGNNYTDENIEVLTSYSAISFSQINGSDGGNFNISAALNGQILTYVSSTDTWENYTGTAAQLNGTKLQLGNVSNISMTGGAIGYVLETDGTGNISWAPKGTLYSPVVALSNATPIIMTVANTTPYTNGAAVTITNVNGVANANVNGITLYVTLSSDFASSGNVKLYTDLGRTTGANGTGLTYTNSPNAIATSSTSGGGGSGGVGSTTNTQVIFNELNLACGSPSLTFNSISSTLTVGNNVNTANLNASAGVTSLTFTSNIATGTAPITVSSSTLVPNLYVARANVSDYAATSLTTTGTFYPIFVNATSGNLAQGANANLTFNAATGNLSSTLLTGRLTTAAQPNITSLGTLTSLAVTGNISAGNVSATNFTGLASSATVAGSANAVAGANVSGQVANALVAGTVYTNAQPNITSVGTLTSLAVTGNTTTGNISTTGLGGNITMSGGTVSGANLISANYVSGDGYLLSNLTIAAGSSIVNGNSNVTITANGNVTMYVTGNTTARLTATSTGVVANGTFSTSGNANVGNLGTAQLLATANVTSPQLISNIAIGTAPLVVTSTTVVPNLYVARANVSDYAATTLTSTGTVYPVFVNATSGNLAQGANANLTFNAATGNLFSTILSATYLRGDGSNISNLNITAGTSIINGTSNVSVPAAGGNVNTVVAGNTILVVTATGANISGYANVTGNINAGNVNAGNLLTANYSTAVLTTAAQPNITSVGTLTGLTLANAAIISVGSNTNVGTFTGNFSLSAGSRLNATYADLAEYYEADKLYESGTVLEFGGDKEVTIADDGTTRVAGVVSTDPAYVMNSACAGEYIVAIALQGRVPTKVRGSVRKGDMMVSAGNGFARPWNNPQMGTVIGKALENFDGIEGVIEVAVGRL